MNEILEALVRRLFVQEKRKKYSAGDCTIARRSKFSADAKDRFRRTNKRQCVMVLTFLTFAAYEFVWFLAVWKPQTQNWRKHLTHFGGFMNWNPECYSRNQDRSSSGWHRICYVNGKRALMLAGNRVQQMSWYEVSKEGLLVTVLEYRWNLQLDRLDYRRAADIASHLLLQDNDRVANRVNPRACLTSHQWCYKWEDRSISRFSLCWAIL